jgi:8-oxo-dGTP pyrophosphatase MutT (NUDIX family)
MTFEGLAYTHTDLDRAAQMRTDPDRTAALLGQPNTAIRREVFEEAGVVVGEVTYRGSQARRAASFAPRVS